MHNILTHQSWRHVSELEAARDNQTPFPPPQGPGGRGEHPPSEASPGPQHQEYDGHPPAAESS